MYSKYVGKKIALEKLGISSCTLLKLAKNKQIEVIHTTGGHRKYNIEKYIDENKSEVQSNNKKNIQLNGKLINSKIKNNYCYIRVSTNSQKDDLGRQRIHMINKYPNYIIIEDIGSGINFNRRGFRKLIDLAING